MALFPAPAAVSGLSEDPVCVEQREICEQGSFLKGVCEQWA